jgi:hypothetical protein
LKLQLHHHLCHQQFFCTELEYFQRAAFPDVDVAVHPEQTHKLTKIKLDNFRVDELLVYKLHQLLPVNQVPNFLIRRSLLSAASY